jgi:hypothetical protein
LACGAPQASHLRNATPTLSMNRSADSHVRADTAVSRSETVMVAAGFNPCHYPHLFLG